MPSLQLSFGCADYDHTRALVDGTVRPDGVDLVCLTLPVEETFFRMARHREFDVAEMSLSSYVVSLFQDPAPFVAIPVFTSRQFRHSAIYVNTAAGIDTPGDLVGKRVGTPEYQVTAGVWVRGILEEHHGVPVDAVRYFTGGQEASGRVEKVRVDPGFDITPISAGQTLSEMLAAGELDALYSPRIPGPFAAGDPRVRRLFTDPVAAERAYYAATGIFPIMHVVVVRSDVHGRHPWVAQSMHVALSRAKRACEERLYDTSALRVPLPWLVPQIEEARALIGEDYWSYGVQPNLHVLEAFLRYHHAQGLSPRVLNVEELFASGTLESFVI